MFSSETEGTPNLFVSRGPDGVLGVEEPEGKSRGRVRGELCPGALARIHMGHSCTLLSAEHLAMLLGTAGPPRLPAAPNASQALLSHLGHLAWLQLFAAQCPVIHVAVMWSLFGIALHKVHGDWAPLAILSLVVCANNKPNLKRSSIYLLANLSALALPCA